MIDEHLLDHLVVSGGAASRFTPAHFAFLGLMLAGVATAGPTWKRVPPPFADDQAALVIVLDASTSMNAIDVQPTRLERARQKIRDLLALREGAKTGLVAYAGSAHVVLPLTNDRGILELYTDAIDTAMMPVAGKRPRAALREAQRVLERDDTPGSIVFLTDGVPERDREAFVKHHSARGAPVQILALGTERGGPIKTGDGAFAVDPSGERTTTRVDRAALEGLSKRAGIALTWMTADDADVRDVADGAAQHLADVQAADGSLKWKDMGYALLFPVVLLGAFAFRRGFALQWIGVLLVALSVVHAEPVHADDSRWANLFQTPDQQGRRHFERGEYDDAASHFEDAMWRGTALYAAGRYEEAIDAFAALDTAAAWFGEGNAFARLGRYEDAIDAFEQALARDPGHDGAAHNRQIVEAAWQKQKAADEEPPAKGGDTLGADEYVIDKDKNKKKRPETEETTFGGEMDQRMAEIWMRQVQTRPADFLRNKFAVQAHDAKEEDAKEEGD